MLNKKASWAVVRRLPRYYRHLIELESAGQEKISSGSLARRLGLTASQVRQDFNCFGGFGQQGYGYNISELRAGIASILKIDQSRTAVIIGAGNLGRALIKNFNFQKYGVSLLAAFDVDPALIGREINGVPVMHIDDLPSFMEASSPHFGILALPKEHVRQVAQTLVDGGVRGIWNFTSLELHMALQDIPVENVHFSESLMVLSYQI